MEYIHIRSLEKYHPGYKDRDLKWAKIFFDLVQGDPEFELIKDEIDKWRFVSMICLELQAKKPLPDIEDYWIKKGFNIKKRPISLTLQMLHNFLEVVTEDLKLCVLEENKKEKESNIENKNYSGFEEATVTTWNSFCDIFPVVSKVKEISEKRRGCLKKRFTRDSFRDFNKIIEAIKGQPFLLGENDRKWTISFDWVIENDTNYLKVLEYKYKSNGNRDKLLSEFGLKKE